MSKTQKFFSVLLALGAMLGLLGLVQPVEAFTEQSSSQTKVKEIVVDNGAVTLFIDDTKLDPNLVSASSRNVPLSDQCLDARLAPAGKNLYINIVIPSLPSGFDHWYARFGCASDPAAIREGTIIGRASGEIVDFGGGYGSRIIWKAPTFVKGQYCKIWVYAMKGSNANEDMNTKIGGFNTSPVLVCPLTPTIGTPKASNITQTSFDVDYTWWRTGDSFLPYMAGSKAYLYIFDKTCTRYLGYAGPVSPVKSSYDNGTAEVYIRKSNLTAQTEYCVKPYVVSSGGVGGYGQSINITTRSSSISGSSPSLCSVHGQNADTSSGCCAGLGLQWLSNYKRLGQNGLCVTTGQTNGICSQSVCGDGKVSGYEDKCNCPADFAGGIPDNTFKFTSPLDNDQFNLGTNILFQWAKAGANELVNVYYYKYNMYNSEKICSGYSDAYGNGNCTWKAGSLANNVTLPAGKYQIVAQRLMTATGYDALINLSLTNVVDNARALSFCDIYEKKCKAYNLTMANCRTLNGGKDCVEGAYCGKTDQSSADAFCGSASPTKPQPVIKAIFPSESDRTCVNYKSVIKFSAQVMGLGDASYGNLVMQVIDSNTNVVKATQTFGAVKLNDVKTFSATLDTNTEYTFKATIYTADGQHSDTKEIVSNTCNGEFSYCDSVYKTCTNIKTTPEECRKKNAGRDCIAGFYCGGNYSTQDSMCRAVANQVKITPIAPTEAELICGADKKFTVLLKSKIDNLGGAPNANVITELFRWNYDVMEKDAFVTKTFSTQKLGMQQETPVILDPLKKYTFKAFAQTYAGGASSTVDFTTPSCTASSAESKTYMVCRKSDTLGTCSVLTMQNAMTQAQCTTYFTASGSGKLNTCYTMNSYRDCDTACLAAHNSTSKNVWKVCYNGASSCMDYNFNQPKTRAECQKFLFDNPGIAKFSECFEAQGSEVQTCTTKCANYVEPTGSYSYCSGAQCIAKLNITPSACRILNGGKNCYANTLTCNGGTDNPNGECGSDDVIKPRSYCRGNYCNTIKTTGPACRALNGGKDCYGVAFCGGTDANSGDAICRGEPIPTSTTPVNAKIVVTLNDLNYPQVVSNKFATIARYNVAAVKENMYLDRITFKFNNDISQHGEEFSLYDGSTKIVSVPVNSNTIIKDYDGKYSLTITGINHLITTQYGHTIDVNLMAKYGITQGQYYTIGISQNGLRAKSVGGLNYYNDNVLSSGFAIVPASQVPNCVGENAYSTDANQCCAGLEFISNKKQLVSDRCIDVMTPGGICSKSLCGDGILTGKENWCNCPQDAKQTGCKQVGEFAYDDLNDTCCLPAQKILTTKPDVSGLCGNSTVGVWLCANKDDGKCESDKGENWCNAYNDCHCGDRKCDSFVGENVFNCATDCSTTNYGCSQAGQNAVNADSCCPAQKLQWLSNGSRIGRDGKCVSTGLTNGICSGSTCGNGICENSLGGFTAGYEDACNCKQDCHCGDGVCDGTLGETSANCSQDCAATNPNLCKKNGEFSYSDSEQCCDGLVKISTKNYDSWGNCADVYPASVKLCAKCGDGVCSGVENTCNCPTDCGCGNGKCEGNETIQSCPQDCKAMPSVCKYGMLLHQSPTPNPAANNQRFWIEAWNKSDLTKIQGFPDINEADFVIKQLRLEANAANKYDFTQCEYTADQLPDLGDITQTCYKGVLIYQSTVPQGDTSPKYKYVWTKGTLPGVSSDFKLGMDSVAQVKLYLDGWYPSRPSAWVDQCTESNTPPVPSGNYYWACKGSTCTNVGPMSWSQCESTYGVSCTAEPNRTCNGKCTMAVPECRCWKGMCIYYSTTPNPLAQNRNFWLEKWNLANPTALPLGLASYGAATSSVEQLFKTNNGGNTYNFNQCKDELYDQILGTLNRQCYIKLWIWSSNVPNAKAQNQVIWVVGLVPGLPNMPAGFPTINDAKAGIITAYGNGVLANVPAQCEDRSFSDATGFITSTCYKNLLLIYSSEKSNPYTTPANKKYWVRLSDSNILPNGFDSLTAAQTFLDTWIQYFKPADFKSQCSALSGNAPYVGQTDYMFYCNTALRKCVRTTSKYPNETVCVNDGLIKYSNTVPSTKVCYRQETDCAAQCQQYWHCAKDDTTKSWTPKQTSSVYKSAEDCRSSLANPKNGWVGKTLGQCYGQNEIADHCIQYWYCPVDSADGICGRTPQAFDKKDDCLAYLASDMKGKTTGECFSGTQASCNDACRQKRFMTYYTNTGKCDYVKDGSGTEQKFRSEQECLSFLAFRSDNDHKCYSRIEDCQSAHPAAKYFSYCESYGQECKYITDPSVIDKTTCLKFLDSRKALGLPVDIYDCFGPGEDGKKNLCDPGCKNPQLKNFWFKILPQGSSTGGCQVASFNTINDCNTDMSKAWTSNQVDLNCSTYDKNPCTLSGGAGYAPATQSYYYYCRTLGQACVRTSVMYKDLTTCKQTLGRQCYPATFATQCSAACK